MAIDADATVRTPPTAAPTEGFYHLVDRNRKWYNNKRLITLHAWLVLLLMTSSTNGFDGSLMNSLQSMPHWQAFFGNPRGGTLGLLNAIQHIGSLSGYPLSPYLSDGLGRRPSVWVGATFMIAGAVLQTVCRSIHQFIGARFLIGFGVSLASPAAAMLVTEVSYPVYRPQLSSLYNSLYYSGNIIASWTSYGTARIDSDWSWRIPSVLQAAPSALQFFLVWFVPESPRWLVSKGKEREALRTLAYYHADSDDADALVLYEFEEIKAAIKMDREVKNNVGWTALVATRGNRRRMLVAVALAWFSQWSGNGLVSYYLNKVFDTIGITDAAVQLLVAALLALWNFAWAAGGALQAERVGRRTLFLASAAGMTLFFTLQTVCSARYALTQAAPAAHAVIAFIFLYYAAYDIAFSPLIISYTLEILPYSLRAKGFNVFNVALSVALIFNQYVNPIALERLAWKYYIVYCCWLVFETVFVYVFVIETKNRTLEETAALFDGEDFRTIQAAAHNAAEVRRDETDEKTSHTEIEAA